MKRQEIAALILGVFLGHLVPPLWAEHISADLILGDRTFPLLRIWQCESRVENQEQTSNCQFTVTMNYQPVS